MMRMRRAARRVAHFAAKWIGRGVKWAEADTGVMHRELLKHFFIAADPLQEFVKTSSPLTPQDAGSSPVGPAKSTIPQSRSFRAAFRFLNSGTALRR
jgi:hypothetical protein